MCLVGQSIAKLNKPYGSESKRISEVRGMVWNPAVETEQIEGWSQKLDYTKKRAAQIDHRA